MKEHSLVNDASLLMFFLLLLVIVHNLFYIRLTAKGKHQTYKKGSIMTGIPNKRMHIPVILIVFTLAARIPAQLASEQDKWLGCCIGYSIPDDFHEYWNQATPENAGKWGSVETGPDYYNWGPLDNVYHYAKDNDFPFRLHVLVWGKQQPWWIASIDSAEQAAQVEEWVRLCAERYPEADYVEVVNEPIERPPWDYYPEYYEALGGEGETGWDWVIWAFEKAREYFPATTKLYLNEYELLGGAKSIARFNAIVESLKERDLIDGICAQGHFLETDHINTITARLDQLAENGLPIQISEYDVNIADDQEQLETLQEQVMLFWEHPAVEGITFWGYIQGAMWRENGYLVRSDGSERPALQWLRDYMNGSGVDRESHKTPEGFQLHANYPNPFNPTTAIPYRLEHPSAVRLTILDVRGRTVRALVNGVRSAGAHTAIWNGLDEAGRSAVSGVYLVRLETEYGLLQRKMMLIR